MVENQGRNPDPSSPAKAEGLGYLKDWTVALIELGKIQQQLVDLAPDVLDRMESLEQKLDSIDEGLTGINITLARAVFVADKMVAIKRGNPDAKPPVEPRKPTFDDVVGALDEFEAIAEAEAAEEERLAAEAERDEGDDGDGDDIPPPAKPPMIANAPGVNMRKLPPPPKSPSKLSG